MAFETLKKRRERHTPRPGLKTFVRIFMVALLSLVYLELGLRLTGWARARLVTGESFSSLAGERHVSILCVGDSWTEGSSAEPGNSYPEQLGRLLREKHPGTSLRIYNYGRSGSNSSHALSQARTLLKKQDFDYIVVLTGNNDFWNLSQSTLLKDRVFQSRGAGRLRTKLLLFISDLRVLNLFRMMKGLLGGKAPVSEFPAVEPGLLSLPPSDGTEGLLTKEEVRKQLTDNLEELLLLSRNRGCRMILMTYFHFHGYEVNSVIRGFAGKYGLPLADNNFLFHTRIPAERREEYLVKDLHPNARGYGLIARWLSAKI